MSKEFETPKTFTLIVPIKVADAEVAEVTLREPTAGDIEKMQRDTEKGGAANALILLIAKQAKLAPTDVRNLGARDFNILQEYLGSFLEPVPDSSQS